jgi:hypothetical protein
MSHPLGGAMQNAIASNNIYDANPAFIQQKATAGTPIFVAPKFTGTGRNIDDFRLAGSNSYNDQNIIDKA